MTAGREKTGPKRRREGHQDRGGEKETEREREREMGARARERERESRNRRRIWNGKKRNRKDGNKTNQNATE